MRHPLDRYGTRHGIFPNQWRQTNGFGIRPSNAAAVSDAMATVSALSRRIVGFRRPGFTRLLQRGGIPYLCLLDLERHFDAHLNFDGSRRECSRGRIGLGLARSCECGVAEAEVW